MQEDVAFGVTTLGVVMCIPCTNVHKSHGGKIAGAGEVQSGLLIECGQCGEDIGLGAGVSLHESCL